MNKIIQAFRDKPLFWQFTIAFVTVILCPIVLINFFSYYNGAAKIREQYEESLRQITGDINGNFNSAMQELDWLTLQIVSQPEARNFVLKSPDSYYEKYLLKQWGDKQLFFKRLLSESGHIGRVSIVGDNGIEYSFYSDEGQEYDKNLYDHRAIVEKAERYRDRLPSDGKSQVFLSRLKEDSSNLYLTLARRFSAGAYFHMAGTVFVEMQAERLWNVAGDENLRNGQVWVLNEKEEIIYQPDTGRIGNSISSYIPEGLPEEEQGSFRVKINGVRMLAVYTRDPVSGWCSLITVPVSQMERPIQNIKTMLFYTLIIAFPLTMLLGYQFIRSILEPVHQLEWYMARLGMEKWEKVIGRIPGNEIGNLMLQYNQMVEQIHELIEKVYKSELQQSQDKLIKRNAQLQALQTQINPHFLYNTLGAINTYAIEADQKEIEQMVSALSKMLRYAVQNPLEPVKIADEAEHVENYLTIMRYRHGRMPRIIWDVKSCLSEPILRLTVQPLIENVFQHAFEDGISEEHFIRIRARREKDVLLEVEDNGIGIEGLEGERQYRLEEVTNITFGIGMSNVNKRIQLIYGEEYGITVFRNQSGGTTVRLVLPEAGSDGRFAGIGM